MEFRAEDELGWGEDPKEGIRQANNTSFPFFTAFLALRSKYDGIDFASEDEERASLVDRVTTCFHLTLEVVVIRVLATVVGVRW